MSHELVEYVVWLLHEHGQARDTRWRKLGCFKRALLTLVHLRKGETFSRLGAGFGLSQATAWRYADETSDVLAGWAPGLQQALTGLGEGNHVIVDGTLVPIDRIGADEPYYSTKHRKHSMNVQVIAAGTAHRSGSPAPLQTEPHDLTAARSHGIVQACLTRQILLPADRAYQDAGATIRTPYSHHHQQPAHHQQFNRDHTQLKAPRRTRLRTAEVLATTPPSQILHPPQRHHRPSHPHTPDLPQFRMKEA
ncbi:transposase family protein [Streptomyces sp. NPDC047981]|uniref:transposase family protein n=1 Tax=Streptomyces sp. NPDC047981 TaxID=3154610 RepID=UPI003431EBF1